jgi:hypothetical protein
MKIEVEVKPPLVPNFIIVGNSQKAIQDFSDDQLRTIGAEWTEELLRKARVLRSKPEVLIREQFTDLPSRDRNDV